MAAPQRVTRGSVPGIVIAGVAAAFAIYFGRAILLPIAFALLIAVTLRPVVRSCRRRRIPESFSASVLISGLVLIGLTSVYFLAGPAREWTTDLPGRMEEIGDKLAAVRQQVREIEEASDRLEDIANGEDEAEEPEQTLSPLGAIPDDAPARNQEQDDKPVQVEVQQPRLTAGLDMLSSAGGLVASIAIALVMAFFMLSQGDVLLNNLLRTLPSMREKRSTVELVYNLEKGISRYLFTVTLINTCLGIAVGIAMWLLGMPNPALWGIMAALFNYVPLAGALVGTIIVFFVAILSFDSLAYASLVPVVYLALTALEGNVITPAVLGRTMQLNPILVLLSLVFWGWMWGIGGALLAVPMLAMLKIGCDRFERTRSIGTLLGGDSG